MSRINTNVNSLLAQRVLGQQNKDLSKSLERLSTGYRINRGADDPAGLIASERLRSEKTSINAAIGNAQRADKVVNIAEGGLQEVNNLLLQVQSLVGSSANDAGLSPAEKQANQQQIDSILQTIDRISQTTSFEGAKLLNGGLDYQVENQNTAVADYKINAAKLETGDTRDVKVLVTQSAQHAGLFLSTGGALDLSSAGAQFSFEVAGQAGAREFTFASGTALSDVAQSVNTFKAVTGVSATATTSGLRLKSTGFGSDDFVSVKVVDDGGQAGNIDQFNASDETLVDSSAATAFSAANGVLRDDGQDIGALINGITATGKGKNASISTDFLDVNVGLTDTAAQTPQALDAFTITGGGAQFNLGPSVNVTNQVSIGVGNVATRNLGRTAHEGDIYHLDDLSSGKALNVVDGDLTQAQKAVDGAIGQVSTLRGRLGAFQKNVVGATTRSLGVALENTSAAESSIRDTDFAAQTAKLTRSQILVKAATNVLGIANNQPQNVLSLLGR